MWERKFVFIVNQGRAKAQVVSRWFPTVAARVRIRAGMWDCGQSFHSS
jgi:hypothetical protein